VNNSNTNSTRTCYMCDRVSTTREHVPPKCIFPADKDMPEDIGYRNSNLITVPSCDLHNIAKSRDDEYIMICLALPFQGNEVAYNQATTKVKRAVTRSRGLFELFFRERIPQIANVDIDRFKASMDKIARGIYYNHYQEKWLSPIIIYTPALRYLGPDPTIKAYDMNMYKFYPRVQKFLANDPWDGAEQDIFKYQIHSGENENILRMFFYGGVEVLAVDNVVSIRNSKKSI
jgi:hypothetical protein